MDISTDTLIVTAAMVAREETSPRVAGPPIVRPSLSVCNCKRWASLLLLHARCGKRGGFIPPKATRGSDPEIRLAGPLLPGNGLLEGAPFADSPRQAQPLSGDDRKTGQGSRCASGRFFSELTRMYATVGDEPGSLIRGCLSFLGTRFIFGDGPRIRDFCNES